MVHYFDTWTGHHRVQTFALLKIFGTFWKRLCAVVQLSHLQYTILCIGLGLVLGDVGNLKPQPCFYVYGVWVDFMSFFFPPFSSDKHQKLCVPGQGFIDRAKSVEKRLGHRANGVNQSQIIDFLTGLWGRCFILWL